MNFFDIILGSLLAFGLYKGFRNGLLVELASFVSLLLGIYLSVQFSAFTAKSLAGFVHWNPKTIQIIAFLLTFVAVVIGISFLAKILTKIVHFAYLGWINKLGGGFFRLLKTILILSVFQNLFEKINFNQTFAKKETLEQSLFYTPIQKTAGYIYPSIQKGYDEFKNKK
jgi:membrane protein required for colicin V production